MARQAQGFDALVAFGKEATQGTAPAAAVFKSWGIVTEFEPEENKNHEPLRGIGSRTALGFKAGQYEIESSVAGYLQNPRPLYYALGKVTKTGAANAWVHTINPIGRCEELPTFSVNRNLCLGGSNFITNYTGSKVDTLTISGSAGEPVEMEIDIIHQKVVDGAPAATDYTTSTNEVLGFAEGIVSINGANVANVTEFELEIANQLEALFTISSGSEAGMINEGALEISGSFTFAITDQSQWTLFKNGTTFAVVLRFQDPNVPANYVSVNLTGAKYDTNAISLGAEDAVEQELDVLFTNIQIVAGSVLETDLTV